MGTDTKAIPPFLCMKADYVVDASMTGFDHGKVIVVPNWKYKIAVAMMKHLPRALIRVPRRPGSRRI
jgi:short-subunit dehydrogenase